MKQKILEACVDSYESAMAAYEGGADRLELCANLIIGGTTPDFLLFQQIRNSIDIPIHVLIRPRFGDFYYSDFEFEVMLKDIEEFKKEKAHGVVIGMLTKEGDLDKEKMKGAITAAKGMHITLNRAFDVCKDPLETLEEAKEQGVHTILTSGQKNTSLEGKELLKELVTQSKNQIDIMAGSGVLAENIKEIHKETGITSFHMSGKKTFDSEMKYRKEGVSMGIPGFSEYHIIRTDKEEIVKAKKVIDKL